MIYVLPTVDGCLFTEAQNRVDAYHKLKRYDSVYVSLFTYKDVMTHADYLVTFRDAQ